MTCEICVPGLCATWHGVWQHFVWQLARPKFKRLLEKQIRHEAGPEQRLQAEN